MPKLALRATAPYLIGERKIAIGELVTFANEEEQRWFISTLNWSAFQPVFIESEGDEPEEVDERIAKAFDDLTAERDELSAKLAALTAIHAGDPIQLTPADPLVGLADAVRRFTVEDLAELPGLGKATAPRLIEWAATIPPSQAIDATQIHG